MSKLSLLLAAGAVAVSASLAPSLASATFIPLGSNLDFFGGIDPIGSANLYTATGAARRT